MIEKVRVKVLGVLAAVVLVAASGDVFAQDYELDRLLQTVTAGDGTAATRKAGLTEIVVSAASAAGQGGDNYAAWRRQYESNRMYVERLERTSPDTYKQLDCQLRLIEAAERLKQGGATNINAGREILAALLEENKKDGLLGWTDWKRHFYRRAGTLMTIANKLDPSQDLRSFDDDNFRENELSTAYRLRAAMVELYSPQLGERREAGPGEAVRTTSPTVSGDLFRLRETLTRLGGSYDAADHFWAYPAAELLLADEIAEYVRQLERLYFSNETSIDELDRLTERYRVPPAVTRHVNELYSRMLADEIRTAYVQWSDGPYSPARNRMIRLLENENAPTAGLGNIVAVFNTIRYTDDWRADGKLWPSLSDERLRDIRRYVGQFGQAETTDSTTEHYARAVGRFIASFADWQRGGGNVVPIAASTDPNSATAGSDVAVPSAVREAVLELRAVQQDGRLDVVLRRAATYYLLKYEMYLLERQQEPNPQAWRDLLAQAAQLRDETISQPESWDNENCLAMAYLPLANQLAQRSEAAASTAEQGYRDAVRNALQRQDAEGARQAFGEYVQYRSEHGMGMEGDGDFTDFRLRYLLGLIDIYQGRGDYQQAMEIAGSAVEDGLAGALAQLRPNLMLNLYKQGIRNWATLTDTTIDLYAMGEAFRRGIADSATVDRLIGELCLRYRAICVFGDDSQLCDSLGAMGSGDEAMRHYVLNFARGDYEDEEDLTELGQFVVLQGYQQAGQWGQCWRYIREFEFGYSRRAQVAGLERLNLPLGNSFVREMINGGLAALADGPADELAGLRAVLAADYLPLPESELRAFRRQCYLELQGLRGSDVLAAGRLGNSFAVFTDDVYRTDVEWADGRLIDVDSAGGGSDWPGAMELLLGQADTAEEFRALANEDLIRFSGEPVAQTAMRMALRNIDDRQRSDELLECIELFSDSDKPQFRQNRFWAGAYTHLAYHGNGTAQQRQEWKALAANYLENQRGQASGAEVVQQEMLLCYDLAANAAEDGQAWANCRVIVENSDGFVSDDVLILGLMSVVQESFGWAGSGQELGRVVADWYRANRHGRSDDYDAFLRGVIERVLRDGTKYRLWMLKTLHLLNVGVGEDGPAMLELFANVPIGDLAGHGRFPLDGLVGNEGHLLRYLQAMLMLRVQGDDVEAMQRAYSYLMGDGDDDAAAAFGRLPVILREPTAKAAYAGQEYDTAAVIYGLLADGIGADGLTPTELEVFRQWMECSILRDLPGHEIAENFDIYDRVQAFCLGPAAHLYDASLTDAGGQADLEATAQKLASIRLMKLPYAEPEDEGVRECAANYPVMVVEALCYLDSRFERLFNEYLRGEGRETADMALRFRQARQIMRYLPMARGYTALWQVVRWDNSIIGERWFDDSNDWPGPLWRWWLGGVGGDFEDRLAEWKSERGNVSERDIIAEAYMVRYLKTRDRDDLSAAVGSFAFGVPEYSAALILWRQTSSP